MNSQDQRAYDPDELLTEGQAADLLKYTKPTLQNWRYRGSGPKFIKVSARSVRYRRRDLNAWIAARVRQSTSDQGDAA